MEFFAFADVAWDEDRIRRVLSMDSLDKYCDSIENVIEVCEETGWGRYFTIWGEFELQRIAIRGGYRFVMPKCPNALTWSITTGFPPHPAQVTIHSTINRPDHDPDFVETLVDFTNEWGGGLRG